MRDSITAIKAEQCRRRFFKFFQEFWETIEAVDLVLNWHIEFLCDELQKVYHTWERGESQPDMLINCPPGVSKSTIIQLLESWLYLRQPEIKVLGTSYSGGISAKNCTKSRDCLQSKKFQEWFPNKVKLAKKGETEYHTTAKGIYYTASTGGTATGNHADFIINDDPLNVKQAYSAKLRESALSFIDGTLTTRKTNKARTVTITVMQRLHPDDPSGHLVAKRHDLNHICLPAELTAETKPLLRPQHLLAQYEAHDNLLDPLRLNRAMLKDQLIGLGPYDYVSQMLQNPSDTSSGTFKKEWFEKITWTEFQTITKDRQVVWQFDADTALTDDRKNDPTALLASCIVDNIMYVRESYALWMAYEALLDELPKFLARNEYDEIHSKLFVEPKANGKDVIDSLRKRGRVHVLEAANPQADKVQRAHDCVPFCAAKRVVFIDGSYINSLEKELYAFPNAAHDDRVDTLTQAIKRHLAEAKPKKEKNIYA